jgi:hypothetical protein
LTFENFARFFCNTYIDAGVPVKAWKSLWFAWRAPLGRFSGAPNCPSFLKFCMAVREWYSEMQSTRFSEFPHQFRVIKMNSTFMWNSKR